MIEAPAFMIKIAEKWVAGQENRKKEKISGNVR